MSAECNRLRGVRPYGRGLALGLLVIVLLFAGCRRDEDAILRFGLATAPVTLDPRYATDATSYRLCRLIYEALVDFDDAFMPIPALATWTALTPTHYRFTLAPGHRFHDGAPLTAADVVATYRSVLDPATASPHRGALANIRTVQAVDPLIVDFELSRADPLFPGLLVIGILPGAHVDPHARPPDSPLGSGPFALIAPPEAKRLRLRRIADGQRVDFIVSHNETARALQLVRGELDLAQGGFAPEISNWLAGQAGIRVRQVPGTSFTYLGFNLTDGPTQVPALRRAIAYAIDREALVHYVFHDEARLANGVLVPAHWAGDPELGGIPHDAARARALLAELGYGEQRPLALSYKTSSDPFRLRLATILQDQLAQIGIRLAIESYDWGSFYADIKAGRFAVFSLSWVGLQLPDIFRYAFHSTSIPPAGANRGRYRNASVDRLIEQAEAAVDLGERARLYRAIQAALLADLPYVPLWYEDTVVVQRTRVVGYDTGMSGHYDGLASVQGLNAHD